MAVPGVVDVTVGGRVGFGTYTCALPAGAVSYLAFVATSSMPNLVPPPGWTLVTSMDGATLGSRWAVYRASAVDNPGTTWERTGTSSTGPNAVLVVGYDADVVLSAPVTAESATSPATTATGEGLAVRLLTRLPSTNADPTYPTAATVGRRTSRQYQAAGNAAEVAVAHQAVASAGAVATATWTGATAGGITALTVMAYPAPAGAISGASTVSLTTPAARWSKSPMLPLWRSPVDGKFHAAVPTLSGHREYALDPTTGPAAGAVLEASQARRVSAIAFDGGKTAVLRYGATTVCDVFDATGAKIVNAASVPLTPTDTDASPVALVAQSDLVLLAASWYGGVIRTARSGDAGATWSTAATIAVAGSTTGVVSLLVTGARFHLFASGNDGVGGILARAATALVTSWFNVDTLPALPAGTGSDDHIASVVLPDTGYPCAVVKTTNSSVNLPLFVQYVRPSTAAGGTTWTQTVIETSPDDAPGYTRPRLTIVGDELWLLYGSINAPQDVFLQRAPLSNPTAWSARETFQVGPNYSDGIVVPLPADVGASPMPWLAHNRASSTIVHGWVEHGAEPVPGVVVAPAARLSVSARVPDPAGARAARVAAPQALLGVSGRAPVVRGATAATVSVPAAVVGVRAPAPAVSGARAARVTPPAARVAVRAPAPTATGAGSAAVRPPAARVGVSAPTPAVVAQRRARVTAPAAGLQVVAYAPRAGGAAATVVVAPTARVGVRAPAPAAHGALGATVRPPVTRITVAAPAPVADGRRLARVSAPAAVVTVGALAPRVGRAPGPDLPDVLTLLVHPRAATLTVPGPPSTLTVHPAPHTLEVVP